MENSSNIQQRPLQEVVANPTPTASVTGGKITPPPPESLAPTPKSSGSSRSSAVNVQPRLEDPNLIENPRQQYVVDRSTTNHLAAETTGESGGDLSTQNFTAAPRQREPPASPSGVPPSPPPSLGSRNDRQQRSGSNINNNNNNQNNIIPPANLRLSFPDFETTGSNQYFLSEPSMSADDDESRIRAPHRLPVPGGGGRVFRSQLSSDEDGMVQNSRTGNRMAQHSPVPSSPGNTSLSSWESPSRSRNRVLLQFTPSTLLRGGGGGNDLSHTMNRTTDSQPHAQQQHGASYRMPSPDRSFSVYAPPPSAEKPETQVFTLESPVQNEANNDNLLPQVPLPVLDEGGLPTTSELVGNTNGSARESPNSFRRLIEGLKDGESISDSLVFDRSPAGQGISPQTHLKNRMNGHHSHGDESIVMDLSESEDEIISTSRLAPMKSGDDVQPSHHNNNHHHPSRVSTFDSDYMLDQAADDEKTMTYSEQATPMPDKKPLHNRHARARSGDAAAATLATGGTDWRGMKMNNIPMPDEDDDEEDDTPDAKKQQQHQQQQQQHSAKPLPRSFRAQSSQDLDTPFSQDNPSSTTSEEEDNSNNNDAAISRKLSMWPPKQPPNQAPQPQQKRSMLLRPPKPDSRFGASQPIPIVPPPPQIVPPPPSIYSTDPMQYSYQSSNGYGKHFATSPPISSSPIHHSYNMWPTAAQAQGYRDGGYLSQSPSYSSTLDPTPRWDSHLKAIEEYNYRQDRKNSWDNSAAVDTTNHVEDRRSMWQAQQHNSSIRSLQSIVIDQEPYNDGGSYHDGGSYRSVFSAGSEDGGSNLGSILEDDEGNDDDDDDGEDIQLRDARMKAERIELERQLEDHDFAGSYKNTMQSNGTSLGSPFSNFGKTQEKFNRASFYPITTLPDEDKLKYPTFICPRCKTRQRSFFGVSNAPKQLEGPTSYLALYFILYVTASLFIFGLEEGWQPLDCIYFAVISLTTAGLGDFVPTTDSNKLICSIFIYFGIACIGLLLGSYIASMLDDKADTDRKAKQADSCPNCARIQNLKDAAQRRFNRFSPLDHDPKSQQMSPLLHFQTERAGIAIPGSARTAVFTPRTRNHSKNRFKSHQRSQQHHNQSDWADASSDDLPEESSPPPPPPVAPPVHPFYSSSPQFSLPSVASPQISKKMASPLPPNILGSPMTRQILDRQSHTRHASFDIGRGGNIFAVESAGQSGGSNGSNQKKYLGTGPYITPRSREEVSEAHVPVNSTFRTGQEDYQYQESLHNINDTTGMNETSSDDIAEISDNDASSVSTVDQIVDDRLYKIKAAKYVILTLQGALGNSLVILVVGCVGFFLVENMTLVDSWYFTTVLLTTTGYGDIVPVTKGGKLFATVYLLVGGTILLHNMSKISMIPLELRKRRIERAVLTQFGDSLDDDALRELATGPLIKRLSLTADRYDGLAECTREMFALAMLVRLGKVSEDDIKQTFAAFKRLDHNNEGVLNSKSIIAGMIHRRRSVNPMAAGNLQRDLQRVQQAEMRRVQQQQSEMQSQSGQGFLSGNNGLVHIPPGQGDARCAPQSNLNVGSAETTALLNQLAPVNYDTVGQHAIGSPGSLHYPLLHQQYPHQGSALLRSQPPPLPSIEYEGAY